MIPRPCLGSTGVTLILLALTCRVYHAFSPSALHVPVVRSQYPCMGNAKTVLTFSNCNVPVLPIRQSLPCTSLSATPPVDDANADPSDEEKVGTVTPGGSSPEETIEDGKKVPFRQKLKKMGLAVVLSYGWVSNMSYAVVMSLAWYGFSKKVRRKASHGLNISFQLRWCIGCLPLDLLCTMYHASCTMHNLLYLTSFMLVLLFGFLVNPPSPLPPLSMLIACASIDRLEPLSSGPVEALSCCICRIFCTQQCYPTLPFGIVCGCIAIFWQYSCGYSTQGECLERDIYCHLDGFCQRSWYVCRFCHWHFIGQCGGGGFYFPSEISAYERKQQQYYILLYS